MNGWGLAPSLQVMQSLSKVTDRPSGESVRENSIYQGKCKVTTISIYHTNSQNSPKQKKPKPFQFQ